MQYSTRLQEQFTWPSTFVSAASAARRRPCTASSSPTRTSPRDGRFIEIIGQYQPRSGDKAINLNDRARQPLARHRRAPTDTVRSLLRRAGVLKARHEARLAQQAQAARRARRRGQGRRGADAHAMTSPALIIVGRVRKAHGIRGELVVEPMTDAPDAVFAPGRRVFAGTVSGDLHAEPRRAARRDRAVRSRRVPRAVRRGAPIATTPNAGATGICSLPADELPPPGDDEVYLHELLGMRVELASGRDRRYGRRDLSSSRRASRSTCAAVPPREGETVLLLVRRAHRSRSVDRAARRHRGRSPPEGLIARCCSINVVTIFPEFFAGAARAQHSRARAAARAASSTASSTCATTRTTGIAPSTTTLRRRRGDGDEARAVLRGGRSARRHSADRADVARAGDASRRPTRYDSRQGRS